MSFCGFYFIYIGLFWQKDCYLRYQGSQAGRSASFSRVNFIGCSHWSHIIIQVFFDTLFPLQVPRHAELFLLYVFLLQFFFFCRRCCGSEAGGRASLWWVVFLGCSYRSCIMKWDLFHIYRSLWTHLHRSLIGLIPLYKSFSTHFFDTFSTHFFTAGSKAVGRASFVWVSFADFVSTYVGHFWRAFLFSVFFLFGFLQVPRPRGRRKCSANWERQKYVTEPCIYG